MRIVLSYLRFVDFGGTESYVLAVAGQLQRLGHDVVIHSPSTGPVTEFARRHGFRVETEAARLPSACDAVLAQDASTAYDMARRYPDSVRLFVAHSTGHPLQSPPQLPGACHAVVVMNDRMRERIERLAWSAEIVRLRQPIDMQRFCVRALGLEQRRPPRVLLLSNYTVGARERLLQAACARAGLEYSRAGQPRWPTSAPEHAIAEAEIVISLGRGALEAMASGRAAYVLGDLGGDGWVTQDSYPALESDGFTGRALGRPIDANRLTEDLAGWTEEMAEFGRDLICAHHDAQGHALDLLAVIDRLGSGATPPPPNADEAARLVRLEWDAYARAVSAIAETTKVRAEAAAVREVCEELREEARRAHAGVRTQHARVLELQAALEQSQAAAEQREAELASLRSSRRYRVASRIARPLDRLKRVREKPSPDTSRPVG